MLLHHCTWPEVEAHLKTSTGVVMPIGSTEQHGPNGLIGTDAICAEEVAKGIGQACGALVGPTIAVGMAVHHMAFPGSMTLKPSTLVLVIRDYVLSLAEHGFTRFFFVNGHGGNVPTIRAAFYEVYQDWRTQKGERAADVRCALVNWWECAGVLALSKELFGAAEGSHATPSEVSLTQHAYPEAIKTAAMSPAVAPGGGFHGPEDFRRRFPDGRIGSDPSLARPEHGKRILEAAVTGLSDQYRAFLAEV